MRDFCNNSPPSEGKYLVVATSNQNKFFEIRSALGQIGIALYSLNSFSRIEESPETGTTFEENAKQKAEYYFQYLQNPLLTEDSGLVIPALNGFPGIHSARIAADDASRIALVLEKMKGREDRSAYYICSLVYHDGKQMTAVEGRCDGVITAEPIGELGFGYDPIFRPENHPATFGQMTIKQKTFYSHRGRAVEKIIPYLIAEFRNYVSRR